MERIGASIRGMYRDILKGPGGNVIYDSGWKTNTIMDECYVLLAGLMSAGIMNNNNASSNGIEYLAVGRGDESWGDEIPEINPGDDGLTNGAGEGEIFRELELEYLDEDKQSDEDVVVDGPTSLLRITVTLEPGHPSPEPLGLTYYPLREFGLFGSLDGETYMINNVRHPVINKAESATLIRQIKLDFHPQ